MGVISVLLIFLQFMLMGRIKWIESVWGMDKLVNLHRKNGRYVLVFIILHMVFILWSYTLTTKLPVPKQLLDFWLHYDDAWQAIIAFFLFVIIALTSIFFSKIKIPYEAWYAIHLMTYVAVLFAFGHQMKLGGDFFQQAFAIYWQCLYVFVFANVCFYRFFRPLFFFSKHQFKVAKVVKETDEVTSIYISGNNLASFPRKAGQFMILRFLDKQRFWQAHPFSLSWGPNNGMLRVSIKDSGDFTHEIHGLKVGTPVFIDGPHGGFTLKNATKKKLLFIAGGIGITPIRSLIEESANEYDIALLYSNKYVGHIALKGEIDTLSQNNGFPVTYFLTEEKSVPSWGKQGRIDAKGIKSSVPDVKSRDIFLCGPTVFMLAIKEALLSLGVDEKNIHFEEFTLH